MKTGVFVGLITLDCIYRTQQPLAPNEKQVAEEVLLAAGGPATNAAIAFQALGNRAILVGALGSHPLSAVVRDDLQHHGIELIDLTPDITVPPPFSSIVVNTATGDRAVISRNAVDRPQPETLPDLNVLAVADCVLIDGHQMKLGRHLGQAARAQHIPVVIDAGSWKARFEGVLPLAQIVIASATFSSPGRNSGADAIAYLQTLGIPYTAVTQGAEPILYQTPTTTGRIPVPQISVVDTLGAGDIFHGAFCHGYVQTGKFLPALQTATQIAALSCQSFGTRQWMQICQRP